MFAFMNMSKYTDNINNKKNIDTLVNVIDFDSSFVIDISKASENNFWNIQFYDCQKCLLRKEIAKDLAQANMEFENYGFRIKLWECYRPLYVQKIIFEILPNPRYIAPPSTGSDHNRGAAVDITLVDSTGKELNMGTAYEVFSEKTKRNYTNFSDTVLSNRKILKVIMEKHNFQSYVGEWWHFRHKTARNYDILDIPIKCD